MHEPGGGGGSVHSKEGKGNANSFTKSLDIVIKQVKKLIKAFKALVAKVQKWWTYLSPAVALYVNKCLDSIAKGIQKVKAKVDKMLKSSVPVVSLILTAFDWVDRVMKPVNDMAYEVDHTQYET